MRFRWNRQLIHDYFNLGWHSSLDLGHGYCINVADERWSITTFGGNVICCFGTDLDEVITTLEEYGIIYP